MLTILYYGILIAGAASFASSVFYIIDAIEGRPHK